MADEVEDVPQPIETIDAPSVQPGVAPLAGGDEPPPTQPVGAISLFLEDHYEEITAELDGLAEDEFKAEVKKKYKALPKEQRSQYKARAKEAKEAYYESLEVYLVSHPTHEVGEKDREGLRKHREKIKRKMEEAQIEEPPVQKKKKKKKKKSLRDRGSRREESPQPLDGDMDQEDRYEEDVPKIPKSSRGGGKKKQYSAEDDERAKQILTNMCTKMKKAADADRNLNRRQKPAIEKQKLLREAVKHLELKHFHQYILEKLEILDVIRDWLTVLPDGSLPELNIRNEMYRILDLFQLHTYEPGDIRDYFLMSSQRTETLISQDPNKRMFKPFCKTIKFLCTHAKEIPANRERLKKMILKWMRPLVGSPSEQSAVSQENPVQIAERNRMLRQRKRYIDTLQSKRARVPQKPWFDFSRNASKADNVTQLQTQGGEGDGKRAAIERTFRQMGKMKRGSRMSSVSINGKFSFK